MKPLTSTQKGLLAAFRADPRSVDNFTPIGVYADAVEEADNPNLAARIRLCHTWSQLPADARVTYEGHYADGSPKRLENITPLRAMQHAAAEEPDDIVIPLLIANHLEKIGAREMAAQHPRRKQTPENLNRYTSEYPSLARAQYIRLQNGCRWGRWKSTRMVDARGSALENAHIIAWREQDGLPQLTSINMDLFSSKGTDWSYNGHTSNFLSLIQTPNLVPIREARLIGYGSGLANRANLRDVRNLILDDIAPQDLNALSESPYVGGIRLLRLTFDQWVNNQQVKECLRQLAHSPMFTYLETLAYHNHKEGLEYDLNRDFTRNLFQEWKEHGNKRNTMFRLASVGMGAVKLENWDKDVPEPLPENPETTAYISDVQRSFRNRRPGGGGIE